MTRKLLSNSGGKKRHVSRLCPERAVGVAVVVEVETAGANPVDHRGGCW